MLQCMDFPVEINIGPKKYGCETWKFQSLDYINLVGGTFISKNFNDKLQTKSDGHWVRVWEWRRLETGSSMYLPHPYYSKHLGKKRRANNRKHQLWVNEMKLAPLSLLNLCSFFNLAAAQLFSLDIFSVVVYLLRLLLGRQGTILLFLYI